MRGLILVVPMLVACSDGSNTYYAGVPVFDYFALDGVRDWQYVNDGYGWKLDVEVNPAFERMDGNTRIVTLDYSQDDPRELLYSVEWSSDSNKGVLIYGYSIEADEGGPVTLDPPVVFSKNRATKGTVETTASGGTTWTSTFEEIEPCPNYWVTEDWECLRFQLDDGGLGVPFAGTWWIASDWGASRFQGVDDASPWQLAIAHWTPTE